MLDVGSWEFSVLLEGTSMSASAVGIQWKWNFQAALNKEPLKGNNSALDIDKYHIMLQKYTGS